MLLIKYGINDDDFIFVKSHSGTRGTLRTLTKYLEDLCNHINITRKGNHKIRKTHISTFIENGINIDTVRELSGHEDEKTTLNNYCFDTNQEDKKKEQLEKSRNKIMSIS